MTAIARPVHRPAGRIDASWRLRALLLLIALTLHLALLGLIRFNKFVLAAPAARNASHITLWLVQPERSATPRTKAQTADQHAASSTVVGGAALRVPSHVPGARPVAPMTTPAAAGRERTDDHFADQVELPSERPIDGQLDVENLERQAVLLARDRSITGEMPQDRLLHALTANEKLTEAVNKSERKDCRSAYAGLGPLAIPFLIENTVTGTGCKW